MNKQKVIDVSVWQGEIDWLAVRTAGLHAIIRLGYSGNHIDKYFARNIGECERLNIPHGVYFYSYAKTTAQAKADAQFVLQSLAGRPLQYPIYYDIEEGYQRPYAKALADTFCREIEKAGYWAGVYANQFYWTTCLSGLDRYTKWCARWSVNRPSIACDLWQYTSKAKVPGIKGNVDCNYLLKDLPKLIKETSKVNYPTHINDDYLTLFAKDVMAGKYGNGEERKEKIYRAVQDRVNELC